ncbi:hypothetical protein LZ30DRAFT_190717 [Colletotrichum cereale]|nr:hypothetical protein LZ30DRAFT_190717 [Colletotrichum cereale]
MAMNYMASLTVLLVGSKFADVALVLLESFQGDRDRSWFNSKMVAWMCDGQLDWDWSLGRGRANENGKRDRRERLGERGAGSREMAEQMSAGVPHRAGICRLWAVLPSALVFAMSSFSFPPRAPTARQGHTCTLPSFPCAALPYLPAHLYASTAIRTAKCGEVRDRLR